MKKSKVKKSKVKKSKVKKSKVKKSSVYVHEYVYVTVSASLGIKMKCLHIY